MADLQPLLPRKISQSIFPPLAAPDAPPVVDLSGMNAGNNPLGSIAPAALHPVVNPDAQRIDSLKADIARRETPVKPTTTLGKIGHVAANIGNVLGDIFAPATMSKIPGTQLGNERLVGVDENKIKDISARDTEATNRANTAATTAYTEQRPAIEQAKVLQKLTSSLAPKGIKVSMNPDGTFDTEDDPESQAFKNRQALQELHQSQSDKDDALTAIATNKYQPGTPEYEREQTKIKLAEQTRQIALKSLGVREQSLGLAADRLGFNEDKNYNPEPTAQERKTGDLAQSAVNQVHTMRQIIQSHPEIFGPAAGRTTSAQAWLGSQSPDAQKFLSASRYLADHSAGVFGSRSVEITKSLEQLTDPKSNPAALNAALDTAESTAQHFVKAGTPHGKGESGAAITLPAGNSGSPKVKKYNPATGRLE